MGRILDVTGLRLDKQPVDHRAPDFGKHIQVDAEPDERKKIHGFGGGEQPAILENAKRATDLVEQLAGVGFQQLGAGVEFVLDDRVEHAGKPLD